MTKKEDEEDIDFEDIDFEEFGDLLAESLALEVEEEEPVTKRAKGSIQIQNVEEYFLELGFKGKPGKLHKSFPDLFSTKLDNNSDKISDTPGVEVSPENLLLSALITIQKEQELKKIAKMQKSIKDIHDKISKNKKVRDAK